MRVKANWLFGIIAISLVSAIAASLLTAVFFVKGYFRQSVVWQSGTTAESTSETTTGSLSAATTQKPTTRITFSPTTRPTTAPTTTNRTQESSLHPDAWKVSLWQVQEQLESIYENVSPSVVGLNIEVIATSTANARSNSGSGLVISEDGIIVTNTGTISIALDRSGNLRSEASINVYLIDHPQPLKAELIGNDALTGLSVLSVDPTQAVLKPAEMAEDPELQVGQMILAIGYPEMLTSQGGLSSGLITAINREMMLEDGTGVRMIQTDAHISQHCSGGPLLNLDGEVIGLANCSINRDISDVMGYALPIEVVQQVAKNLVTQGYVSGRAWLGVTVLQESNFLELQNLYRFPDGLYISSVIKDSPAYTADLRKGDIITKINENDVETHESLMLFLQSQAIGAMVDIEVYRKSDGQYHQLKVYLQEYQR
ncbi:MAG: serine protease [Clostridiaceae bacterium]|nr:serine protease [Clostridiaceae bacterium]